MMFLCPARIPGYAYVWLLEVRGDVFVHQKIRQAHCGDFGGQDGPVQRTVLRERSLSGLHAVQRLQSDVGVEFHRNQFFSISACRKNRNSAFRYSFLVIRVMGYQQMIVVKTTECSFMIPQEMDVD